MGYESRVYICNKHNLMGGDIWYEILCAFNMCKMGDRFVMTFKDEIEKGAFFSGIDYDREEDIEDNYGYRPTVAKGEDVLKCLDSGEYDGYWRAEIFKQTLKQAMEYINGDSLYVVHMGY